MLEPRFCGCKDINGTSDVVGAAPGKMNQWPEGMARAGLRVAILGTLPGLSRTDTREAAKMGWGFWTQATRGGIKFIMTTNHKTAHIQMRVGKIDRRGGTLAWSYLPTRSYTPTRWRKIDQLYDNQERWGFTEHPQWPLIDSARVISHEGGHGIGMDHGGNGLMAPRYNPRIRRPQAGYDTDQALRRYPFAEPDPPQPPPPGPTPIDLDLEFAGHVKIRDGKIVGHNLDPKIKEGMLI
jgi:hypothetical protein